MQHFCFDHALLPGGWQQDMVFSVDSTGRIDSVRRFTATPHEWPGAIEHVGGYAIPGMPNAHSHAFQRAMAGAAEQRQSGQDSFWGWRELMYELANTLDAESLETVASQAFVEMLDAGYTSVAEFHYLHRELDGSRAHEVTATARALARAADAAGIGLCIVPAAYRSSDFGDAPLRNEQRRFDADAEWIASQVDACLCEFANNPALSCAVAIHSLRAFSLSSIRDLARNVRRTRPTLPIHIHIAEQQAEVDSCLAHTGQRPVEHLLDSGIVDAHWCLVHATHANQAEIEGMASLGCAVCLCPTTEANLGDGEFDTREFLQRRGVLCIGSDSQVCIDPTEELRWLEYQQRLRTQRRVVLAPHRAAKRESRGDGQTKESLGESLWQRACSGGAAALGMPIGELRSGARADLVVLDAGHPSIAGAEPGQALDALIFAGARAAIRDVMVAGRWRVRDGRHSARDSVGARYTQWRRDWQATIKMNSRP